MPDFEDLFGGEDEGVIPADQSWTGEPLDYNQIDDDAKREYYRELQGKYTKKRQAETNELKGYKEKLAKFEKMMEWPEYQKWAQEMLKKYPDKEDVHPNVASAIKRIEAIESKIGVVDDIQGKEEIAQINTFAAENNLPPISKYYKLMDEIVKEKCEESPDGKCGLSIFELYLLASVGDLIKMVQKGTPPTYISSSGRGGGLSPESQILSEMAKAAKTGW